MCSQSSALGPLTVGAIFHFMIDPWRTRLGDCRCLLSFSLHGCDVLLQVYEGSLCLPSSVSLAPSANMLRLVILSPIANFYLDFAFDAHRYLEQGFRHEPTSLSKSFFSWSFIASGGTPVPFCSRVEPKEICREEAACLLACYSQPDPIHRLRGPIDRR